MGQSKIKGMQRSHVARAACSRACAASRRSSSFWAMASDTLWLECCHGKERRQECTCLDVRNRDVVRAVGHGGNLQRPLVVANRPLVVALLSGEGK